MAVFEGDKLFNPEKVKKSLDSIEWETPPEIFNPINSEFNFTIDVCANQQNKKCEKFFDKTQNGLSQDWDNEICWCNPPYGRDVKKWVRKAYEQSKRNTTTVLLIPCKTNTNWWHDLIIPFAEVRFIRGRVRFIQNGIQYTNAYVWSLAFIIFRPHVNDELKLF